MYLTDLEEIQRQVFKKILNLQKRKRKYDLREIWNVVFYFVKTGCQWRMPPSHFTSWGLFITISEIGFLNLLMNNL